MVALLSADQSLTLTMCTSGLQENESSWYDHNSQHLKWKFDQGVRF